MFNLLDPKHTPSLMEVLHVLLVDDSCCSLSDFWSFDHEFQIYASPPHKSDFGASLKISKHTVIKKINFETYTVIPRQDPLASCSIFNLRRLLE